MNFVKRITAGFLLGILLAVLIGCGGAPAKQEGQKPKVSSSSTAQAQTNLPPEIKNPHTVKSTGTIEVAFSPHGGGTEIVVKAIGEAKRSIRVQAYSFTSAKIAESLLEALKRNVEVRVILDKSQETAQYSSATFFANQKIPLKIDNDFAIAHSKIMIIDEETVVTGSFNFTKAAEENNAENVLVIRGNKELAALYLQNWQWRWDNTDPYKRTGQ